MGGRAEAREERVKPPEQEGRPGRRARQAEDGIRDTVVQFRSVQAYDKQEERHLCLIEKGTGRQRRPVTDHSF